MSGECLISERAYPRSFLSSPSHLLVVADQKVKKARVIPECLNRESRYLQNLNTGLPIIPTSRDGSNSLGLFRQPPTARYPYVGAILRVNLRTKPLWLRCWALSAGIPPEADKEACGYGFWGKKFLKQNYLLS